MKYISLYLFYLITSSPTDFRDANLIKKYSHAFKRIFFVDLKSRQKVEHQALSHNMRGYENMRFIKRETKNVQIKHSYMKFQT